MLIRLATHSDIESILSIVRSAQLSLKELGIDQWQDGYPSKGVIVEDITQGVGYVICSDAGAVVGYEAIVLTGEEAYNQIADETWNTSDSYVVVHRLCVSGDCRRCGVAQELMAYAAKYAVENGVNAFRIDTHKGNVRMLSLLHKLGFKHVGIVKYDSGEREAFDMNLNNN
jgi:ribosomal protein S18 acetylase RimI-like enzyme